MPVIWVETPERFPHDTELISKTASSAECRVEFGASTRRLLSAAVACYSIGMKQSAGSDLPKWAYVAFAAVLGIGFLVVTYFAPML
jgi:hypothetical protein